MSVARIREILARHGLALHRDRGQNFLVDESLARRLVRQARVGPEDLVIEVGTGLGWLTRALAESAARVVTFEIDAGVVRALRAEALLPEGVTLHHQDALAVDWDALLAALTAEAPGAPLRIVANLPYSVATPLLRRWLDVRDRLAGWAVMLQREMAARLVAPTGHSDYGSLTVLHRLCVDVERAQDVHPRAFYPAPRVASSFLVMTPRAGAGAGPDREELARVERVARAGFAVRRKTLANALRLAGFTGVEAALESVGVPPRARAETVEPETFRRLAHALGAGP